MSQQQEPVACAVRRQRVGVPVLIFSSYGLGSLSKEWCYPQWANLPISQPDQDSPQQACPEGHVPDPLNKLIVELNHPSQAFGNRFLKDPAPLEAFSNGGCSVLRAEPLGGDMGCSILLNPLLPSHTLLLLCFPVGLVSHPDLLPAKDLCAKTLSSASMR